MTDQTDTFQHGDVGHGAEHIVFSQVEIHFTVFTDGKAIHFLIYLDTLFPKFLSHLLTIIY